jgi:hypothetical protein
MPAHAVVNPGYGDRLAHVSPGDDEEDGGVAGADRDAGLSEQDGVADGRDADTEDAESVAVPETVGAPGCDGADDGGDDEDGD